ncbi:MAG TPA: DsbA family oxidoreductase [Chryseosolibacter sp.]|nr:DsbA family oxidoreductase [Chryseosolibacter sp.]
MKNMKIDIWSDVRCPFCYIGKRKFERALEKFEHRAKVQVVWHSFQLDPQLKTQTEVHAYDYLAKVKGITYEQAVEMHERVIDIGAEVDINFAFDRVIVANSFNAHRLIQLAKVKDVADAAEEALFKAHFVEGKNIDDQEVLVHIGEELSIPVDEVRTMLLSEDFAAEVQKDESLARSIGIRGVPFFILMDKYAVSGAQAPETFLQALTKVWNETQSTAANV